MPGMGLDFADRETTEGWDKLHLEFQRNGRDWIDAEGNFLLNSGLPLTSEAE